MPAGQIGEPLMNQAIEDFVACRNIAVVGAVARRKNSAMRPPKNSETRGYQVFHPSTGPRDYVQPCYPNLTALRGQIDVVFISVPAVQAAAVMREAASLGIRHVWVQQGAEPPTAGARRRNSA